MPIEKTRQIVHDLTNAFYWADIDRIKQIEGGLFDLSVKEVISYNDYKDLTTIASNLQSILERDL